MSQFVTIRVKLGCAESVVGSISTRKSLQSAARPIDGPFNVCLNSKDTNSSMQIKYHPPADELKARFREALGSGKKWNVELSFLGGITQIAFLKLHYFIKLN